MFVRLVEFVFVRGCCCLLSVGEVVVSILENKVVNIEIFIFVSCFEWS